MRAGIKLFLMTTTTALLGNCSDLPCMKSYEYHNKANAARTPAEKAYYENEAAIYDQQCAAFNEKALKNRKDEEARRH